MQEGCAADTEFSESGFLKDFSNSQFELGLGDHKETNRGQVDRSNGPLLFGASLWLNKLGEQLFERYEMDWSLIQCNYNDQCVCLFLRTTESSWGDTVIKVCREVASADN